MSPAPSPFAEPPVVVGHRGAPRLARENTPASFAAAAAAGATWVELDARLDGDGTVVVHHDPVLPDGTALIDLGTSQCQAAGVDTLQTVLADLPAGLGVDLEIKNFPGEPDHDETMQVVTACAALLDGITRPLMISSFNPMVLLSVAEHGLAHPTGLLTVDADVARGLETALELGCAVLCPHHTAAGLEVAGVQGVHDRGLAILVWTVDEPAQALALAEAGVDAICTNDPPGIHQALRHLQR